MRYQVIQNSFWEHPKPLNRSHLGNLGRQDTAQLLVQGPFGAQTLPYPYTVSLIAKGRPSQLPWGELGPCFPVEWVIGMTSGDFAGSLYFRNPVLQSALAASKLGVCNFFHIAVFCAMSFGTLGHTSPYGFMRDHCLQSSVRRSSCNGIFAGAIVLTPSIPLNNRRV